MLNFNRYKDVIIVYGLKRSGNHAIINWIAAQGRFKVYNNVIPIAPILAGESALPKEPPQFMSWLENQKSKNMRHSFLRSFSSKSTLLITLEDHELSTVPFRDCMLPLQRILILRDAPNMFASRIRKSSFVNSPAYPAKNNFYIERVVSLWKQYAKEFLSSATGEASGSSVCIYFNAWHQSRSYRADIADRLGLRFTDARFTDVSKVGGGSSFDAVTFRDAGNQMNVLARYSDLSAEELQRLNNILADTELTSIQSQIDHVFNRV